MASAAGKLFAVIICSTVVSAKEIKPTSDPVWEIRHLLPEANLSNNSVTNVTVQVGATAFLPCLFRHLADHQVSDQVSWFRRRDWHILTTGIFTYTTDERFSVLHPDESDDWTLQIKYTTNRDNGTYECQLSTGTGVISQFVNLEVVVPKAVILGSKDYHVQLGSTIRLVCIIEESPTPPQYVFWYHDDGMINYDTRRGGINVSTETGQKTSSRLTILDAHYNDTGNYTCSASNTQPASTSVYVSHGDKMAAILRRKSSSASSAASHALLFVSVSLGYVFCCVNVR
ncbi:Immunoglobulin V-set domain [Trinorchestia longiramus]|nr:Immunoglobulin V-set domain [Trinorchestia longiramus]